MIRIDPLPAHVRFIQQELTQPCQLLGILRIAQHRPLKRPELVLIRFISHQPIGVARAHQFLRRRTKPRDRLSRPRRLQQ